MSDTVTQVVENRAPSWAQPHLERLGAGASQLLKQPYQRYQDPRIAGFTGMENMAMQGIGALGMAGDPRMFRNAMGWQNQAMGMAGQAPGMGYRDLSGIGGLMGQQQMWPDADHAAYMNPYQQNVTDVATRNIQQAARSQLQDVGSNAALSGAFGGGRHALLEGDVLQNARQQIGDVAYQGQRDAYNAAMGQFNADQSRRLRGLQGMAGAFGQANNLYQAGIGQLLGGANQGARFGQMQQGMAFDRLNAMNQYGQQQRALQQAMMDQDYNDFMAEQNYGWDQLGRYGNILQGIPYQGTGYQSTAQNNPGLFQTALGTGITGLQMANQYAPPRSS